MSHEIGLSTEVQAWLDRQGEVPSQRRRREFYALVELCIQRLRLRGGQPDGDRLRSLSDDGLCKFWLYLTDTCWNVTYYVATPKIPLLTVFRTTTEEDVDVEELARAYRKMLHCIASGGDVANV